MVVDKNDIDGKYVSSKDARLFVNAEPIARTITCKCGGGQEVHHNNLICVAMRGRGMKNEQTLEPNMKGTVNALTTVQKDNLVRVREENGFFEQAIKTAEKGNAGPGDIIDAYNKKVIKNGISPTITTRPEGKKTAILPCVEIKQATKEGTIKCKVGGCFDASYPDSKTRRGRVQEDGDVVPTLTAGSSENINYVETRYRIRKLTPKECWRLMGFKDEDFEKAQAAGVSNSQLYKQAGNSIVKQVLMGIFKQMNPVEKTI